MSKIEHHDVNNGRFLIISLCCFRELASLAQTGATTQAKGDPGRGFGPGRFRPAIKSSLGHFFGSDHFGASKFFFLSFSQSMGPLCLAKHDRPGQNSLRCSSSSGQFRPADKIRLGYFLTQANKADPVQPLRLPIKLPSKSLQQIV